MNYRDEISRFFLGSSFSVCCSLIAFSALFFIPITVIAEIDQTDLFFAPVKHSSTTTHPTVITYGPVATNEGLWDIASKLRVNQDTTIEQMAVALFKRNPKAFNQKNMNDLLVGAVLQVPENAEVVLLSEKDAFTLFQQHWQNWQTLHAEYKQTNSFDVDSQKKVINENISENRVDSPGTVPITPDELENNQIIQDEQQQSITLNPLNRVSTHTVTPTVTPTVPVAKNQNIAEADMSIRPAENGDTSSEYYRIIDNLFQVEFAQTYNQIKNHFNGFIYWVKYDFDFALTTSNLKRHLNKFPLTVVLIIFSLFILLVFFFRKQEKDFNPRQSKLNNIPASEPVVSSISFDDFTSETSHVMNGNGSMSEQKIAFEPVSNNNDSLGNEPLVNDDFVDRFSTSPVSTNSISTNSLSTSTVSNNLSSANVIPGQVNINKFLSPVATEKVKKSSRNGKGLLEAAFDKNMFLSSVGFIQQETLTETEESSNKKTEEGDDFIQSNLLDTVEELRFVNESTRDSKIETFWSMTETENLTDDVLISEFLKIKNDEKLDVFIEEFEQIMSDLSQQTPAIKKDPGAMENIIQFKLSVHFIKVLSEMMQATYLQQFSSAVIEFLEDILDGKTVMTVDVAHRLLVVVNIYDQYIHSVKETQHCKIQL